MRNKRGDIPITILVIGVFVVCTLALLSFFVSSINLRNSFVGVDFTEETNKYIEKKQFDGEDLDKFSFGINKTKILPWTEDELSFSIKYEKL